MSTFRLMRRERDGPGPLRVRSVVGLAYDELRAMIVDGRLAPGARVGQAELADALGISRGSVREALRRLAGDGLVEFEVNRGFFVADLGLERVLERLEARLLLEPGIARLAAERRTTTISHALRRAVVARARRAHRGGGARRQPRVPRGGRAATRNDALTSGSSTRSGSPTSGRRLLASRRTQPDWQEADVAEHAELLAAIEARDGDLAETLMREHVESAWRHWARRLARRRGDGVSSVRLVHVLSENWTLTDPRDLRALVRMAQEAEDAGFDAVMVSEHVVLGRGADADGLMPNPRDYALPGNQDPAMPWPSSLVLLSAIAAATTTLRLAAAAIIAPLRHPLLLAKDLATLDLLSEGRLVVLPTVSWHEPEYRALGVPFADRGALLDEHLAAWQAAWGPSPASFAGRFYAFEDVWVEPKPLRPDGRAPVVRLEHAARAAPAAHGAVRPRLEPARPAERRGRRAAAAALAEAGRDPADFELVGGTRGRFPDADSSPTSTRRSPRSPRRSSAASRRSASSRRSSSTTASRHAAWCRDVVARVDALCRIA